MNSKRIIFWACFVIILGLIIWGLVAAQNKSGQLSTLATPAAVSATDHVRGNPQAPVTLIEYGDFQCPACGAYYPVVEKAFADSSTTVRIVFRNFPLSQHANAIPAAEAAEAAAAQGKFWEMFGQLYSHQADWAEASAASAQVFFANYASAIGLDLTKFKADAAASSTLDFINAQEDEGIHIGINHTPTFFVNGKEVTFTTPDELTALISKAAAASSK